MKTRAGALLAVLAALFLSSCVVHHRPGVVLIEDMAGAVEMHEWLEGRAPPLCEQGHMRNAIDPGRGAMLGATLGGGVRVRGGVLTASHVVPSDDALVTANDDRFRMGRVLKRDETADIVLLASTASGSTPLRARPTHFGEQLVLGLFWRDVPGVALSEQLILIPEGIEEGWSGSAVFDRSGYVVGVLVAKREADERVGVFVPSPRLAEFVR